MLEKTHLDASFPDARVYSAYMHPAVEESAQQFYWGNPNLDGIREYLGRMLGWSVEQANQVLLPVIQERNRRKAGGGIQQSIEPFLPGSRYAAHKSQRVQRAVSNLKRNAGPASSSQQPKRRKGAR